MTEERSAGNPHATFCGNRRRVTASDDPVDGVVIRCPYPTMSNTGNSAPQNRAFILQSKKRQKQSKNVQEKLIKKNYTMLLTNIYLYLYIDMTIKFHKKLTNN
jgi:hypothetical protein